MAFDFDPLFGKALDAGLKAAQPGGQAAQDWIRESARANAGALRAIAEGVATRQISRETGAMLLDESGRALQSEAAALAVTVKAAAQAAVDAFLGTLLGGLKTALKLAL
ncbi:hypothetical protein [uncultured Methylibium sp.]|uniref:hypothetical protein n=1 Tax=uncultured Methylibium sp. TaxID=381093 RepID=UPI0025DEE66A|nr:hypothetical protein [uncultured Methylibium sp.]